MQIRGGRRAVDRGAAAVEAALVLPLLLMIVFGIIDFGRMLHAQITVTEAAREGARALSLGASPKPRVEAVMGNLAYQMPKPDGCAVNPPPDDNATVTVTHTFTFVTPVGALAGMFGGGGFGDEFQISATGVMPCRA